jgi:hypothetical protein
MRETIELNAHLFETATLPDYVIAFLAHVENWQAILSSAAGAISQAGEIAPYPEDFSRRIEEAYLDVARRHTKLVGKVRGRGLQKLSYNRKTEIGSSLRIWIPDSETGRKSLPTEIPTNLPTNQNLSAINTLKNNRIKVWVERFALFALPLGIFRS